MRRDMRPAINELATYELCFGNAINVNSLNGYNIKTSGFTVNGIAEQSTCLIFRMQTDQKED